MATNQNVYITTSIPYVNAEPHLGHALEFVQADVLARHQRSRGLLVRFLTGTDDNALKNVTAARSAGVDVREFVDANARRFLGLQEPLSLSFDDVIRTSADLRHRIGVERLWEQCARQGDFYRRHYEGLYCGGCEQFYRQEDLPEGLCPEHRVTPEPVVEENWFFRLSRYAEPLLETVTSGQVRIEPATRRNEVLAFIRAGLEDFSVSRPAARANGWGIPVPGDPGHIIYVWWDALANYITALGYGGPDQRAYQDWWVDSAARIHVIGKGITRFHAVYWLALLLSAGQPLPTTIHVHEYLTVDGAKLSKSTGNAISPEDLVRRFGTDAVRWWLLREVARLGDTDFTVERLVACANRNLANGIGNLQNRTLALVHKFRAGRIINPSRVNSLGSDLVTAYQTLPHVIDDALTRFDFRAATEGISSVVDTGNRLVEAARPWELARREKAGDLGASRDLDDVLGVLVDACRVVAHESRPFIPNGAAALLEQLSSGDGQVSPPTPVFPRWHGTTH
ncbi:methionine--tRNA ligase [Phytoactinopolyspora alkaliphila]|uniref:methionine--tRNA ligase n=1 Tax=Phytoactinopolyspora alkaliphila TaxID=1783498 RepID=A0A6N9YK91_9ACTN|nr:methionine--tRNA ligase [Phytoactinopolyspora alkaliphila]NED95355.1 methionine--tRNA ligase [Phytoactinopolyspora alkaliphila]